MEDAGKNGLGETRRSADLVLCVCEPSAKAANIPGEQGIMAKSFGHQAGGRKCSHTMFVGQVPDVIQYEHGFDGSEQLGLSSG